MQLCMPAWQGGEQRLGMPVRGRRPRIHSEAGFLQKKKGASAGKGDIRNGPKAERDPALFPRQGFMWESRAQILHPVTTGTGMAV